MQSGNAHAENIGTQICVPYGKTTRTKLLKRLCLIPAWVLFCQGKTSGMDTCIPAMRMRKISERKFAFPTEDYFL